MLPLMLLLLMLLPLLLLLKKFSGNKASASAVADAVACLLPKAHA